MAKKHTTEAPKVPEPEPKQEPQPEAQISKMEAVRRALADDAEMQPQDGVAFIKTKFGIDISPANFSAYKSQIKNAGKNPTPRTKAQNNGQAQPDYASAAKAAMEVKALCDSMTADSVKAIAEICLRIGASNVLAMVQVFTSPEA